MAMHRTVLGIDIGASCVKAAWVRRTRGGGEVVRTEVLNLPAHGPAPAETITRWIAGLGVGRLPCVLGFPGAQTMFHPVQIPADDPRPDRVVADIEMVRFHDMAGEEMYHDALFSGRSAGARQLMLMLARPQQVHQRLGQAAEIGITPWNLTPTPVALWNSWKIWNRPAKDAPVLLINCGHRSTELAVVTAGEFRFTRSIAMGSQEFTEALAADRKISYSQAETFKQQDLRPKPEDAQVLPQFHSALAEWIEEIKSCISLYTGLYPDENDAVSAVVTAGGGCCMQQIDGYISGELQVPVSALTVGGLQGARAQQAAVAAGLALPLVTDSAAAAGVLPPETRDELVFRRQKPFWIAAAIMAALTFGISLAAGYYDFRRMEEHLKAHKVDLVQRQRLAGEIETIRAGTRLMAQMSEPVMQRLVLMPYLRDTLAAVSAALTSGDRVVLISDRQSYFAQPADTTRRRPPRDVRRAGSEVETLPLADGFIIEGHTKHYDLQSVRELIIRLADVPFIASVDLLSDDMRADRDFSGITGSADARQRFVIDVRFGEMP